MIRTINDTINRKPIVYLAGLFITLMVTACSETVQKSNDGDAINFDPLSVELTDPVLIAGRETWSKTCKTCHSTGLTGAPIIGDKNAWKPRIEKGLDTLFDHATNGFIGPTYSEMPPKGGFRELSDEEVKNAVRFMTFVSK